MPYDKFGGYHSTQTAANHVNNNTWSNGSSSHDSRNRGGSSSGGGHSSSGGSSSGGGTTKPSIPSSVNVANGYTILNTGKSEVDKNLEIRASQESLNNFVNNHQVGGSSSGGHSSSGGKTTVTVSPSIPSGVNLSNGYTILNTGKSEVDKNLEIRASQESLNNFINSHQVGNNNNRNAGTTVTVKPSIPSNINIADGFTILTPNKETPEIVFPQNTAGDNFSLAARNANITPIERFLVDSVFAPLISTIETTTFKPNGEFSPISLFDHTPIGIAKNAAEKIMSGKEQSATDIILGENTLFGRLNAWDKAQGNGFQRGMDIASTALIVPTGAIGGTIIKTGAQTIIKDGIKTVASKNIPIVSKTAKEFTENGIKGVAGKTAKTGATLGGNLVGYGTLVDLGQNTENDTLKDVNLKYSDIDDSYKTMVGNINFGNSLLGGALNVAKDYVGGAVGGIGGFIASIPNAAVGITQGAKYISTGDFGKIGNSAVNSVKNFGNYLTDDFSKNPVYGLGDMLGFGTAFTGVSNVLPKIKTKADIITGKVDDRFTEVTGEFPITTMSKPLLSAIQAGNLREGIVTGNARIQTAPSNILGLTSSGIYTKGTKGTTKLGEGITNTNIGEITPNAVFKGLSVKSNPDIVNGELKHGNQITFLGESPSDLFVTTANHSKKLVGVNTRMSEQALLEFTNSDWKPSQQESVMYVNPVLFGAPSTSSAIHAVHGKDVNKLDVMGNVVNMVLPYAPRKTHSTYSTIYYNENAPYIIRDNKRGGKLRMFFPKYDDRYRYVDGLETAIYERFVGTELDSVAPEIEHILKADRVIDGVGFTMSPKQLDVKTHGAIDPEAERMMFLADGNELLLDTTPRQARIKSMFSGNLKNNSKIYNTDAKMTSRFDRIIANNFGRVRNYSGRPANKQLWRTGSSIPKDVVKAGTLDSAFRLTELLFDKNKSDISGHNYPHVHRVYENAKKLNEKQGYGINDDVLWVSSMLHDVAKNQSAESNLMGTDHARAVGFILNSGNSLDVRDYYTPLAAREFESRLTPEELSEYNRFMGLIDDFRADGTLKDISKAISQHTTNLKSQTDRVTRSKLSKVLSDADRMDLKRYNKDNPYWLPKESKMFASMDVISDIMYGKTAAEVTTLSKTSKSGAQSKNTTETDTLVSGISEIYKAYNEKKPIDSYTEVYSKGGNVAGVKPYYAPADMSKAANIYAYAETVAKDNSYSYSGADNNYSAGKKSVYNPYTSPYIDYSGSYYGGRVNYQSAPHIDYGITPNYQKVNYGNYDKHNNDNFGGSYAAMIGLGDATLDKKRKMKEDRERKLKRKRVKKYKNYTTYTPIAHPFSLLGLENIKTGYKEQKWKGAITVTDTYDEMLGITSHKVKGKLKSGKNLEDMFGIRQDLNKKRKTKKSKKANRRR